MKFEIGNEEALIALKYLTKRETKEDVIRDALSLYQFLSRQIIQGAKIYLGKSPDKVEELVITTFENITK